MKLTGTVVNGLVAFDGPARFPEGSLVTVELVDEDAELDAALTGMPVPPPTETYEEHLALLRQSVADAKAGERGLPLREAMARIAEELNLPRVDRG